MNRFTDGLTIETVMFGNDKVTEQGDPDSVAYAVYKNDEREPIFISLTYDDCENFVRKYEPPIRRWEAIIRFNAASEAEADERAQYMLTKLGMFRKANYELHIYDPD